MSRKKSNKPNFTTGEIAEKIEKLDADAPKQPVRRRYKTNDPTIEKLGELLCENPAGILIFRDELVGLLAAWEKSGHEGDRTFYLESWNGNGSFDTDRIGRGSIFIPNLCLSIFGGIQPDKLRSLLELMADALANDGTLQRFGVLVYPDAIKWEYRDRFPNKGARDKVYEIFKKLTEADLQEFGASPADEYNKFPYFNFSPEAQEVFIAWSENLHNVKIPAEDNMLIAQHLIKYNKLFPSLALIFHLVECVLTGTSGNVSKQAALQAQAWCEYLETHARRCYGLLADEGLCAAQALAEKIIKRKLKEGFTARNVFRPKWKHLVTPEAVQDALTWLEEDNWLRSYEVKPGKTGGRTTTAYKINPKIKQKEAPNAIDLA